jgi:hypothetical protein
VSKPFDRDTLELLIFSREPTSAGRRRGRNER